MRDILGLGCATLDELLFVDEYPAPDHKVPVSRRVVQGGGLTATALVAASRLGANCAYAGTLGHDGTSRRVELVLQAEGIDTSLVARCEDAGAIRSLIIVDTTRHTRNIFFERPSQVGAALDSPSEAQIRASRVLFVDHYGGAGNVRAIRLARQNGVSVVADFERKDVPEWDSFWPLVDHLVLSKKFAAHMSGESDLARIARALWNAQRSIVIVTDGENGGLAFDGRDFTPFSSPRVEVRDTTGCGDVFHGVYAATLAWGFDLPTRLKWAATAAALSARFEGAQAGAPSKSELEKALA